MSLSLYIEFASEFEIDCPEFELLPRNIKFVDSIAQNEGVEKFSKYLDNREVPDGFSGSPDELNAILGERTDWYDSKSAFKHFQSIIQAIKQSNNYSDEYGDLLTELVSLKEILSSSLSHSSKFRLDIL